MKVCQATLVRALGGGSPTREGTNPTPPCDNQKTGKQGGVFKPLAAKYSKQHLGERTEIRTQVQVCIFISSFTLAIFMSFRMCSKIHWVSLAETVTKFQGRGQFIWEIQGALIRVWNSKAVKERRPGRRVLARGGEQQTPLSVFPEARELGYLYTHCHNELHKDLGQNMNSPALLACARSQARGLLYLQRKSWQADGPCGVWLSEDLS